MMARFFLHRLIESLILLLLLSFLVFALFKQIPGDYLDEMALSPGVSAERIESLRRNYGLDRPIYVQYSRWLGGLLRGELGYSFAQQRPAFRLIVERLAATLQLSLGALIVMLILAIPMAVVSALHPGRWPDRFALAVSLLSLSLPTVLASLLFLYAAFWTGWLPVGGRQQLSQWILPSLTLALPLMPIVARTLRMELLEQLRRPYLTAAMARGLPRSRLLWHAMRNALNPVISMVGIIMGALLSGAVIVEKIFAWPGLGSLALDSILSRDLYVALNCVLVAAVLVVAANLAADLVLALNDPRIRMR